MKKIILLLFTLSLFAHSYERIIQDITNHFNGDLKILNDEIKCKDKICTIKNPKVVSEEDKIEFYEADKIIVKLIDTNTIEANVINLKISKQFEYVLHFTLVHGGYNAFPMLDCIWDKLVALNLKAKITLKDKQMTIDSLLSNKYGDTARLVEYITLTDDLNDSKKLLYFLAHAISDMFYYDNTPIYFTNHKSILSLQMERLCGSYTEDKVIKNFFNNSPHILSFEFGNFGSGNNGFLINSFRDLPVFVDTELNITNTPIDIE